VTDFVTPAWFGFKDASGRLDFQNHSKEAFSVLTGGYAQKFGPQGWTQITGDKAKAGKKARILHPPKGSRRERRLTRAKWMDSVTMVARADLRSRLR
jgi:hypothetical protein